jgi:cytochrome c2
MNKNLIIAFKGIIQLFALLVVLSIILIGCFWVENDRISAISQVSNFSCGVVSNSNINHSNDSTFLAGEAIFKSNCTPCHAVTDEIVVGPGLKGIEERRSKKWIIKWIQNPSKVLDKKDKYALALYEKFNKTQMTAFPNLKKADIDLLLAYIKATNI